ncbi:MAG: carbamoyltransferase HypF [Nitrospiraceae bacterium]|nr:MAG: carbamoyltransferase HypF [Nitrospiraceae bacterium]
MKHRMQITIKGIVQGVGFRPFIYNLARRLNLSGYVLNNTTGVSIEVEGEGPDIKEFLDSVKTQPPPQADIFEIKSDHADPIGYENFEIRESEDVEEKFVPISPELATCKECVSELFDPKDRRHRYPFINCTNCGPRFTIVKDIPYDRKFTTMSVFPMCEKCNAEYHDPADRRFHAQPNACPVCGPRLFLLDSERKELPVEDVISGACRLLKEGKIIAVKGLGGYHLACDAQNRDAVARLRARKFREYKPFAIMVKDLKTAKEICFVNEKEEQLLSGVKRPIVLLKKRPDAPVSEDVAPDQKYFGVMLPYTPLHHLLLAESGLILVMTSANISSEPIVFEDKDAFDRLKDITDYYVIHNREIHIRTDDSVSRVERGKDVVLRRSRGYAPHPLLMKHSFTEQILACGAELKNTFCLTRGNYAFLSHHIGDLENLETLSSFESGIEHFKRIFNIEPAVIAYDLHPEYLSTKYAHSLKETGKVGVQHHHAHIISCMGDNGLEGEIIGVSFDGTGYGLDGKIWGGEFLVCNYGAFQRAAHFEYFQLNGGEKAIKEPWRIAASLLYKIYGDDMMDLNIDLVKTLENDKWHILKQMIEKGVNSPLTSSAGRIFDAVSALLGIRKEIYYEGQAAIELETKADPADKGRYEIAYKEHDGKTEIVLVPLIKGIVSDLAKGTGVDTISARFHNTMAGIVLDVCLKLKKHTGTDRVALSGGVFQNSLLMEKTCKLLDENGFKVYTHRRVPTNDGGLSLGQAIIANERIKAGKV